MFKVAHQNVRSLLSNFDRFQNHILDKSYDVVSMTETWLDDRTTANAVNIPNFTCFRQDRSHRGGGVGVYVSNAFNSSKLLSESNANIEHIWIKIINLNRTFVIGTIYRPPQGNLEGFFETLNEVLLEFYTQDFNIILMGDININLMQVTSNSDNFNSLIDSFALKQIINEPTRITATTFSLIDVICINTNELQIYNCEVIDTSISDHYLTRCTIKIEKNEKLEKNIRFRKLYNINIQIFNNDLNSIDWQLLYNMANIDDKVNYFNNRILDLFDKHAPLVIKKINKPSKYVPWITENIKLLQKLRDKALTKFKNTKTPSQWNYYKQLRNFTTTAIRNEKKAYLNYKFRNGSTADQWRELKKLNLGKSKNINFPNEFKNVDKFKNFYKDLYKENKPSQQLLDFYDSQRKLNFENLFEFTLVDEISIRKILYKIKTKAFGHDCLNINLLLLCCPEIIPVLTHLMNVCIENYYFPLAWKEALVTPLAKIGNPTSLNDFRSISILPVLSKILEKIIESQLRPFLNAHAIIPKNQSGFRPGFSCATALSCITDDILKAYDDNKVSILVLLDYSKAFDMINHRILLSILHYIGLDNNAIRFLGSFLSDRQQRVQIGDEISDSMRVSSGVPQGSILGPLLYILYTSNFYDSFITCNYHVYADDTQLYCSFNMIEMDSYESFINRDLEMLYEKSKDHLLNVNPSKSSVLVFANDSIRSIITSNLKIKLGDMNLKFVDNAKNLGLILDSKLRFKLHVNSILKKSYGSLKMIYPHRHYLNKKTKQMLSESLVLSHSNYCDVVYGPNLDSIDKNRLQYLQNSCLRLIFSVKRREHISHKLSEAGWLSMNNRRILHMCCFYYKILKYKNPEYLLDKIRFRTDVHNINIRKKHILDVPKHKKEIYKRSFTYNICKLVNTYNILNFDLSVNTYIYNLKRIILQQQEI